MQCRFWAVIPFGLWNEIDIALSSSCNAVFVRLDRLFSYCTLTKVQCRFDALSFVSTAPGVKAKVFRSRACTIYIAVLTKCNGSLPSVVASCASQFTESAITSRSVIVLSHCSFSKMQWRLGLWPVRLNCSFGQVQCRLVP